MPGGGSCEIFAVDRGADRWVLRRAPRHASSSTAHDVLREFRILDAIKDEPVAIARPVVACDDPDVFGAPFYVMERIDGRPILSVGARGVGGRARVARPGARAARSTRSSPMHAVDWRALRPGRPGAPSGDYLARQVDRWLHQLDSYGGRDLPAARRIARLARGAPPGGPTAHAVPRRLQARQRAVRARRATAAARGRRLGDGRDRRPARRPRVGADLPPRTGGHDATRHGQGADASPSSTCPTAPASSSATPRASGRDVSQLGWYDVFSRWKLAVVLEGSYAKFLQGHSDKPIHEFFGSPGRSPARADASVLDRTRRSPDAGVAGAGRRRAGRRAARGRARPPEPGPGQVRIRVDRGRHRVARRAHVPRHLPAHSSAAVHAGPGGHRRGHRGRRGASTSPIGTRVMAVTMFWQGMGSFAEECLVDAGSAFAVAAAASPTPRRRVLDPAPHRLDRLVDRGRSAAGDWLAVLGAGGSGIAAARPSAGVGSIAVGRSARTNGRVLLVRSAPTSPSTTGRADRSPTCCATRRTATASTSSTTRSAARWPRTRPRRWPATDGCSRSASPAARGR